MRTKWDTLAECSASCLANSVCTETNTGDNNRNNRTGRVIYVFWTFSMLQVEHQILVCFIPFIPHNSPEVVLLLSPLHKVGNWSPEKRMCPKSHQVSWSLCWIQKQDAPGRSLHSHHHRQSWSVASTSSSPSPAPMHTPAATLTTEPDHSRFACMVLMMGTSLHKTLHPSAKLYNPKISEMTLGVLCP